MKQIKIVIELKIFTLDHPFNQEGAHLPRIATVPVSPISLECLIRDEIFWCWLIRCWNETVRISGQSKPFMWGKWPKWKRGKLSYLRLYVNSQCQYRVWGTDWLTDKLKKLLELVFAIIKPDNIFPISNSRQNYIEKSSVVSR